MNSIFKLSHLFRDGLAYFKTMINRKLLIVLLFGGLLGSCTEADPSIATETTTEFSPLFKLLPPEQSGVTFSNRIEEGLNLNVLMYEYLYNGGGVAVGDLNQDGLEDIYFSANVSGNQLYLNQGNLSFKETAQASGTLGRSGPWKTGVVMVDINADGKLDIYLCYSGVLPPEKRKNQLFVNQGNDQKGNPVFVEMGEEYGVDSSAPSTSASFFDFDLDGDLDLFLLNHNTKSIQNHDTKRTKALLLENHEAGPQLYENNNGKFVEVTLDAGISSSSLSYGLGVSISDINRDGWPDIYIGNDYSMPDYLYINQKDGTFVDEIHQRLGHTSHFSMGNDIADFNNDGLVDIYTLDMLPEDNERQKLLLAPDNFELFQLNVDRGFHHQYMRNMLHINAGDGTFQEIAQLAGVSNTDWSWAALFADFDNDGWKDLFVTNGYLRDYNNQDFLNYMDNYVRTSGGKLKREDLLNMVHTMPSSNLTNYIFQNTSALTFQNKTRAWGIDHAANSNGAAYSDLDNDGDVDLIVNNINSPAFIYVNESKGNFLKLKLEGENQNLNALGARVALYSDGMVQILEQNPYRGYQSSVSPVLHFGLGKATKIDSLEIQWPGGKVSLLYDVKPNEFLTVKQSEADRSSKPRAVSSKALLVAGQEVKQNPSRAVNDYKRQPLLINPISENGKAMTLADFNGDGQADLFLGGGADIPASLLFQQANGTFKKGNSDSFISSKASEDTDAVAFDANGDGDMDLFVASGGVHSFGLGDTELADRLYLNDGKGNFKPSPLSAADSSFPTGAALAGDFNGDGFPDLFMGGRVNPGQFPTSPGARLLINDGKGNFSDRTKDLAPAFLKLGMLTDAVLADLDNDADFELVVLGEAMPVQVFSFREDIWVDSTLEYFDHLEIGLWNDLTLADWDGDGNLEIFAGNLGTNSQLKTNAEEPAEILYKDFDANGSMDAFLSYYIQGKKYPAASRNEILGQVPFLKKRYLDFKSFSKVTMDGLFTPEEREGGRSIFLNRLETTYFVKNASGKFEAKPLPVQAQFSPVYASAAVDVNGDGNLDMLLGGNVSYGKLYFGRYDASRGQLLIGNGKGGFRAATKAESGLDLKGNVRKIITTGNKILFYQNDGGLKSYTVLSSKTD